MEPDLQKILNVARNYGDNNVIPYMLKEGMVIDLSKLERLEEFTELAAPGGVFKVRSYKDFEDFTHETIMAFCNQFGIYCFPTSELVDFLREKIAGRKTIEVAAGHGIICKELDILGTDNFEQRHNRAELYEVMRVLPVQYGKHVEFYDAVDAVRRYKPDVVIAAWMTHQYNPGQYHLGGNMTGPAEEKILEKVKEYIFIGNDKVHGLRPLLDLPHEIIKAPWLLSRTKEGQNTNSIYIWKGEKK